MTTFTKRSIILKKRLAVEFGISLVLITIFLVIDSEMDLKMMPKLYIPMDKRINSRDDTDLRGVFQALERKFE